MSTINDIVAKMRSNPHGVKFSELLKVCTEYFGEPRNSGGSHFFFKTPWPSDPRVNIQNNNGMAKAYQVKQVLKAIDKANESEKELDDADE